MAVSISCLPQVLFSIAPYLSFGFLYAFIFSQRFQALESYFACARLPGTKTSHWQLWCRHFLKEAIPGAFLLCLCWELFMTHFSIPLSAWPSIHPSIYPSTHPSTHPHTHPPTQPSIHLLNYSFIQQWFIKHLLIIALLCFTCHNV